MSSQLVHETVTTLKALAEEIPPARNGKRTALSTILRWITKGVRLPDGRADRLEAFRCASRWFTSREAFGRFVAAQTPTFEPDQTAGPTGTKVRTPAQRQHASEQAARELEKLGI